MYLFRKPAFKPWTLSEHLQFMVALRDTPENLLAIAARVLTREFSEVVHHVKVFTALSLMVMAKPTETQQGQPQQDQQNPSSQSDELVQDSVSTKQILEPIWTTEELQNLQEGLQKLARFFHKFVTM